MREDSLKSVVETLVKVSSILAAAGYISLRERMKLLGIPTQGSLGTDQYLLEIWGLCWQSLLPASIALLFIWLLAEPGNLALARLKKRRVGREWLARAMSPELWSRAAFLALGASGLVLLVKLLGLFTYKAPVIGILSPDLEIPSKAEAGFIFNWAVVQTMLCWWWLTRSGWAGGRKEEGRRASILLWGIFLLLLLLIPCYFGRYIQNRDYFQADITLAASSGPPVSGLFIGGTDKQSCLWTSEGGEGRIACFSAARIQSIIYGPQEDILEAARKAAKEK